MNLIKSLIKLIIIYMPGNIGIKIRRSFYSRKLKSVGKNLVIGIGVIIENPERMMIGDDVRIDNYCIISTVNNLSKSQLNTHISHKGSKIKMGELNIGKGVRLGSRTSIYAIGGVLIDDMCAIGEGTKIYSQTHIPNSLLDKKKITYTNHVNNYKNSPSISSNIMILKNTFVGLDNLIMPGTYIGENSFVFPRSLTNSYFEKNSYISGSPAKKIKNRFG
jgi:acetyltransferase-like isoleucine patch superfamily enzyme